MCPVPVQEGAIPESHVWEALSKRTSHLSLFLSVSSPSSHAEIMPQKTLLTRQAKDPSLCPWHTLCCQLQSLNQVQVCPGTAGDWLRHVGGDIKPSMLLSCKL